ncbi:MAG: alanine racemase, partial [Bacteroidota bacterium]
MITDTLSTPTLLIDEARVRANARRMLAKAQKHGLRLRPHFKTHQSLEVGRWLREEGVQHATVSSLTMARYFAPEWNDITVAF